MPSFEEEVEKYHAPLDVPRGPAVVLLTCKTCGHWKSGLLPYADIIAWLRVHRCAGLFAGTHEQVRESSCPTPCTEGE